MTAGRAFTVAIDGPAASGKGTIARALAAHFDFAHLDTGLLYRAVGARMLRGDAPVTAAETLTLEDTLGTHLRTPAVAEAASKVAALPEVRRALFAFQRRFAARDGGAVLDGRDIGTVICPEADVKLYVVADAPVRAQRRFDELRIKGFETSYEAVLADVEARDARDTGRVDAPLKPAEDATLLDTSQMAIEEAVARASALVKAAYMPGSADT
ncbi:MAG: d(CMP) kinase [Pseudomonadota bacterium]